MQKFTSKISVVVPCYNVENYLRKCLDSLVNQTYSDFEVLMVEDCSTDSTKKIVSEYHKKYKNFKAIYNSKNGGLGNARNVGIGESNSEYITFLDSDDWVPNNYLDALYNAIIENKSDLSVCDIYIRYDDPKKDHRVFTYTNKKDRFGFIDNGLAASSNNKLFNKNIFNNLEYPTDIINEDIPVTLYILSKYKAAHTTETYYNYYQRSTSIQNSNITKKRFDIFKAVSLLESKLDVKNKNRIMEIVSWHQIISLMVFVLPKAKGLKYRRDLIKDFHKLLKKADIKLSTNKYFNHYLNESRAKKIYGLSISLAINKKMYYLCSALMSVFNYYINNRYIGRLITIARHPLITAKRLFKKLYSRITRKIVFNNHATIDDLIELAKNQSQLDGNLNVSVIIPNYNYERYMVQRLYSILSQSVKIGEIIILDDCSTDKSVDLINKITDKIQKYVSLRLIVNKANAGTFSQWEKGINESRYDYFWIAEADDYSGNKFLETALAPMIEDKEIVMSYVNTGYANEMGLYLGDVKKDIDYQKSNHWDGDYLSEGIDEFHNYSYLNNSIANVSSIVFKKISKKKYQLYFREAKKYRQAGDWVFYVNYMLNGKIYYTDKVLNYYRIHGNNVSSTTKAQDHINEIEKIQSYFMNKLKLSNKHKTKMTNRIKFLKSAWGLSNKQ